MKKTEAKKSRATVPLRYLINEKNTNIFYLDVILEKNPIENSSFLAVPDKN
jgi:hypothetical protein